MKLPRISYNAPVVLTFALIALVYFALPDSWQAHFGAYPSLSHGYKTGLVGHIFAHMNWNHYLGNFMLILLLGPLLEERFGSVQLMAMIGITALVTGIVNILIGDTIIIGASGIVFMMILLASTANIRSGDIPLTFIAVAVIYLGGEISRAFEKDNISQMGHLVGGITGAAFGFLSASKANKSKPVVKTSSLGALKLDDPAPSSKPKPVAKPAPKPAAK